MRCLLTFYHKLLEIVQCLRRVNSQSLQGWRKLDSILLIYDDLTFSAIDIV